MSAKFFDWLSRMQPRQLLMLSGGVAIFIFALLYIVLTFLVREPEENPETTPPEITMQSVVVAARNIDEKVILRNNMLELKDFPEDAVPADAVTDITEVVNKPTRAKIFKGDIITPQKVYSEVAQASFTYSIPPNCRAISIAVNDITGVAGFAKPGDFVDVILVEKNKTSATSRILLQNVLLLSINKNIEEDNKSKKGPESEAVEYANRAINNPTLATLALKPEEVLQLTSATKLGDIYLMLRPLKPDEELAAKTDYTLNSAEVMFDDQTTKIEITYGDQD